VVFIQETMFIKSTNPLKRRSFDLSYMAAINFIFHLGLTLARSVMLFNCHCKEQSIAIVLA